MQVPGENPQLDAETTVPVLYAISIAFVSVSTIVVALRLYTRYVVVGAPGADDATIAVAQVLSIGVSIATILQANHGLGRHEWMVSADDTITQLKCLLAAMTVYNAAQIMTKLSFLFQYRRIFQEGGYTRVICLYLIIFLAAWGITQEVLVCFSCVPISVFIPSQAAVCIDSLTVWYLTSIMNIITDFVVFMVPMPAIRALQLPRRQKILVISIFCLGFFTCAISIVRLFTLRAAINTSDPSWDNVPSAYWSIVELNCGILCASLPPLRPLMRHFGLLGMSQGARSYGYQREDGHDIKGGSFFKARKDSGPPSAVGVYPLANVTTGSQDGLYGNAAGVPLSPINRSAGYPSHQGGGTRSHR